MPSKPENPEPKSPHVRKRSKTPQEKGVTIKEPLPPTNTKAPMVEGKGKSKLVEPPSKKQKMTLIPDPRQAPPAPEFTTRPGVDVNHRITLNQTITTSDDALASRTVASVVRSLNLLGVSFGRNSMGITLAILLSSACTLLYW